MTEDSDNSESVNVVKMSQSKQFHKYQSQQSEHLNKMRSSCKKCGKTHPPNRCPAWGKDALDAARQTILHLSADPQREST